ncbi:unnamed protein product, partial [Rotaria sordida]
MLSLSQVVEQDNLNIDNSQQYDGDQTLTNNNDNNENNNGDNHSDNNNNDLLSTLLFIPHRSINNPSPNTISSRSENSSLSSEILNTNNTIEPQNNNFIDQTTESDNHLRNELLPLVEDIMKQLTNMLDYDPLNIEQLDSTSNMTENILDNPMSSYRNESKTNNHKQNQNRSVLANIELLSNSNSNNNNNTVLSTETTSNDTVTFLENMSSQETLKLISGLLQNKKHLLKRILDEEDNDFTTKRSRNNENEEITSPFFDMNLSGSLSSTPTRTECNTTIVTDGLLIKGNWFAMKKVNGSIDLLPGFLKAFPKNNPQDQLDFARLLAT